MSFVFSIDTRVISSGCWLKDSSTLEPVVRKDTGGLIFQLVSERSANEPRVVAPRRACQVGGFGWISLSQFNGCTQSFSKFDVVDRVCEDRIDGWKTASLKNCHVRK